MKIVIFKPPRKAATDRSHATRTCNIITTSRGVLSRIAQRTSRFINSPRDDVVRSRTTNRFSADTDSQDTSSSDPVDRRPVVVTSSYTSHSLFTFFTFFFETRLYFSLDRSTCDTCGRVCACIASKRPSRARRRRTVFPYRQVRDIPRRRRRAPAVVSSGSAAAVTTRSPEAAGTGEKIDFSAAGAKLCAQCSRRPDGEIAIFPRRDFRHRRRRRRAAHAAVSTLVMIARTLRK